MDDDPRIVRKVGVVKGGGDDSAGSQMSALCARLKKHGDRLQATGDTIDELCARLQV